MGVSLSAFIDSLPRSPTSSGYVALPTSFDPNAAHDTCFLRSRSWRWRWLTSALSEFPGVGVLDQTPSWWQLTRLISYACNDAQTYPISNVQGNMALTGFFLRSREARVLITADADIAKWAAFLREEKVPFPLLWIAVGSAYAPHALHLPEMLPARIFHSLHGMPGVPFFESCHTQPSLYHLECGYSVIHNNHTYSISGTEDDAIPFSACDFEAPFRESACQCGRTGYTLTC